MQVITTVQEMLDARASWTSAQTVGLVPTMGYLHEGHASLIRQARDENAMLLVSIFVNPTQFSPGEDLARYPRDLPRDLHLLEQLGVDAVFSPGPGDMYPPGFATYIDPGEPLATVAEGASRPGHFRGVATVVHKLFQITQPRSAYFGQKDAQQVAVISRMVTDLNLPVTLHILPIIREPDGLAMSSRNAYLNQAERAAALILYKALLAGQRAFTSQVADPSTAIEVMKNVIASEPGARLDYIELRDPRTFLSLEVLQPPALLLIAAHVGSTRLIDNFLLRPDGTWNTGIV